MSFRSKHNGIKVSVAGESRAALAAKRRRVVAAVAEAMERRLLLASVTVNSVADAADYAPGTTIGQLTSGTITLRDAIDAANSTGGNVTIDFDPALTASGPATIGLSIDGDDTFGPTALPVTSNIVIDGPTGTNGITIDRGSASDLRLFYVAPGGSLALENLTLSGGLARGGTAGYGGGGAGLGGAIVNAGTLNLMQDTLTGNQAIGGDSTGGGVGFGGGGLSGVEPNTDDGGGPNGGAGDGGNYSPGDGGNGAAGGFGGGGGGSNNGLGGAGGFGGGGGAAYGGGANGGFGGGGGNGAVGGFGGGSNHGGGAGFGGAVLNYGGTLAVINSTFANNSAVGGTSDDGGSNGAGYGGAIFNLNGSASLTNATLASNTADTGGAVYSLGDDGIATQSGPALPSNTASVTIDNSILAGTSNGGADFVQATNASDGVHAGAVASAGADDIIQSTSTFGGTSVQANPMLGSLGNYGGPTQSVPLLTGSPAIDAGSNALAVDGNGSTLSSDQRGAGYARIVGTVDIGAFENQVVAVTSSTANLAGNAGTITIAGTGFDPTLAGNSVAFNNGAVGEVTAATADSLTVTFSAAPAGGALTAVVTANGSTSETPVQVANVTPVVTETNSTLAANAGSVTITGLGFDPTAADNTVTFDDGAAGTVTAATATSLTVALSVDPIQAGNLSAVVTTDGQSSGDPVQVAAVIPVVSPSTASLAIGGTTVVINGLGFDPNAADDSVVFNDGAAGAVMAATATSLNVSFSTLPASPGSLTAEVTVDSFDSGTSVQVAVVPTVSSVTSSIASLTDTTVTLGGDVTYDGGEPILTRGVLYSLTSTNANPTLGGDGVTEVDDASASSGTFSENVTGLPPLTDYSFVAFATNALGTTYSAPVSTLETSEVPSLVVNTLEDVVNPTDDLTSLREAIAYADSLGGNQTVSFDPSLTAGGPATIALNGSELYIADSSGTLTISGPGSNLLTINGEGASTDLEISGGTRAVISGLTLTGGHSGSSYGGGIYNDPGATLTLNNTAVSGNYATYYGGGIYNRGTLTINGGTISSNSTAEYGGGIYTTGGVTLENGATISSNSAYYGGGIYGYGTMTLTGSTISQNSATEYGAGIYTSSVTTIVGGTISHNTNTYYGGGIYVISTTTINGTTISSNTSKDYGGGIYSRSSLTISNSTISSNTATLYGGGIYSTSTLTVSNSTLSSNTGTSYAGGIYSTSTLNVLDCALTGNAGHTYGGAIFARGVTNIQESTLSSNSATYGGAVYSTTTLTVQGSTLSANTGTTGKGIYHSAGSITLNNDIDADITYGTITSGSYNVFGPSANSNLANGSNHNVVESTVAALGLGTLGSYGGTTQTIPLLPGSPAIDAGSNALAVYAGHALSVDQRGIARIINSTVDCGAYESQGFTITAASGNGQGAAPGSAFATPLGVQVTANDPDLTSLAGGLVTLTAPASGASATFSSNVITLNSSGAGNVTATANSTAGVYNVVASATGITAPASFSLANATTPIITIDPASQTMPAGQSITFTAAAGGSPAPTVQWQVSSDGGSTFTDISGATSATYTFAVASDNNGQEFQAVFSNTNGSATTTAATLTVGPVVTAATAPLAASAGDVVINGFGFDATAANDTVAFNDGAVGSIISASPTSLDVDFTTAPTAGNLTAVVTADGQSNVAPVQVATVTPVVTSSAASLGLNATTITIAGFGFDPVAANNSVVLDDGAAGDVTAATANSLTVMLSVAPAGFGSMTAVVLTDGQSSGAEVQVATVVPIVTVSTAALPANATSITISGFGFDSTPANDTITFNDGAVGNITSATATSLTVALATDPTTAGTLSAVVNADGQNSDPVQVATVTPVITPGTANLPANATSITITGFGFDPTAANDTVTFNDGTAGTVSSASPTSLTVAFSSAPGVAGSLTAVVTTDSQTSGSALQVATVTPVVTPGAATLPANATSITLDGYGFDPTAADNTVTFNDGAIGSVTAATQNSLTVSLSTGPTTAGDLSAVVTTDGVSSGDAVQVATVTPVVTVSVANLAANATSITVAGFGFDPTTANDSVVFNDGAVGGVTAASTTSLTVTFTTPPVLAGNLTAVVTTDGETSGGAVQAAAVTPVVTSSSAILPADSSSVTIAGFGFDSTVANDSVTFNDGAVGNVIAAIANSLTVHLATPPGTAGSLTANVTTDGESSGDPVQVANVAVAPMVTSPAESNITNTTATLGGNAIDDGGAPILARGVLYSLTSVNPSPSLGGPGVFEADDAAATTGTFSENLSGLSPLASYSWVAFATNLDGTTYTSPVSTFSTSETPSLVVNTTGDVVNSTDGLTSLREAVAYADSLGGNQTISFSAGLTAGGAATITLDGAELLLDDPSGTLTIDGPGAGLLTIRGNHASRVFEVAGGTTAAIDGVTIADGNASAFGGGVLVDPGATLTIEDSAVLDNSAQGGGGIYDAGTVNVSDSVISGNASQESGAGIYDIGALTVVNTTISDNDSQGSGGGIYADSAELTLSNSTLAGNTAQGYGAGIDAGAGTATLDNTIVADGMLGALETVSGADNLFGPDGSGGLVNGVNGNIVEPSVAALGLGALGNYGGSTQAIPLLPGSPAIDAGGNALAVDGAGSPLATDQRGISRIIDGTVDIGAYESQGFTLTTTGGGQSTIAGTTFANALGVQVTALDSGLTDLAGGIITFAAPLTGASAAFSSNPVTLDSAGDAGTSATANDSLGNYTVTASAAGIVTPASFSVTNLSPIIAPAIAANPVGQTVAALGNVTFAAAATGTPTPTVQWQLSTDNGATFNNVSGATDSTLTFAATESEDGNLYRAVFTNSGGAASTSAASLTVTRLPASVVLSDLTQTFDGTSKAVTVTTTPSISYTVTYSQDGQAVASPTNAGSYLVSATLADPNYTGSATGTLVIDPAPVTINLSNLSQTYDGSAESAIATTTPADVATTITYSQNGQTVAAPTDAGSYLVSANSTDPNYAGSVTGTLVIDPASVTINLSNLSQTYDGSAESAVATTTPADVAVAITYSQNGQTVAVPTNAGSYLVSATSADPNYTGSATGTLVIDPAPVTIDLSSLSQTYDGSAESATATTTPADVAIAVTYSQNGQTVAVPTDAGSYFVSATLTDPNYSGSVTGTLVIDPAQVTINLSNLSQTYDGSAESAIATTTPADVATTITYSQNTTTVAAPTNAGSYLVSATSADPNYTGSATGTLVIDPAPLTIDLSNLSQTYDGSAESATATTTPADVAVAVTYSQNGQTVAAPTDAGSYLVSATSADPNYTGSATGTLEIDPAPVTIDLSSLSQTYDGSAESATATTTPADVATTITYSQNGQTVAAPTSAGSYLVSATSADPNYTGSATGTLEIDPEPLTINLSSLSQTYDGSAESATATTTPAVAVAVTYSQDGQTVAAPTDAGSYLVSVTSADPNYTGSATGTLVIDPAPVTINLSNLSQTYDGSAESVVATTTPADVAVAITYSQNGQTVAAPTDAGSYLVSATSADPNYTGSATGTLEIDPAPVTIDLSSLSQTYDGSAESATATTTPADVAVAITYSQDGQTVAAPTNAGSYLVSANSTDPNYIGSVTGTLVIDPTPVTIDLSNLSQTYDGSAESAVATTTPADVAVAVTYSQDGQAVAAPTDAGSYLVSATSADPNYTGSATGTLEIDPAPVTIDLSSLSQTYDGSAESATATTTPADVAVAATYSQNGQTVAAPTDAGSYLVSATSADPNYTGSATGTLEIDPAPVTIDLSSLSQTYDGSAESATATTTPADVATTITYSQNGQTVAAPTSAGSYLVSATSADPNYIGSVTGTWVIDPTPVTIDLSNLSQTYDGSAESAVATTTPADVAVAVTYSQNGQTVAAPTDAGSYLVSATSADPNYTGSATGTLEIDPAPVTIDLSSLSQTYDGSAESAIATTTPADVAVAVTYSQDGQTVAAPTDAGSYLVSATSADPNYIGSVTGTLVIDPAPVIIDLSNLSQTYDGSAESAIATTTPADVATTITYSQNGQTVASPTSAGSYLVSATSADPNYIGSVTGTLVIDPTPVTIDLSNLSQTYDGSAESATATTTPADVTVAITYSQNGQTVAAPTDAGSYLVSAASADPNYTGSATSTLVIDPAPVTIDLSNLSQTYDGSAESAIATTTPADVAVAITYSQNGQTVAAPTDAGSYLVSATSADPNYTGSATGTLEIDPEPLTINLSSLSQTYDGSAESATATTTPADVAVAVTYSQDGQTVAAPTDAGSYLVSATSADPNYIGSVTGTLVIDPAPVTIDLSGLSQTYDGSAESAVATTTPADVATTITYSQNGEAVAVPTNAGNYLVSAISADPNYTGSATGTLVIDPAPVTIDLSGLSQTYDGSAESAVATTTPADVATTITYSQNGQTVAAPTDAGSYLVSAISADPNYTGSATGTLVIDPASLTIDLSSLLQTYDGSAESATATTSPADVATTVTYSQNGQTVAAPTDAGSYLVSAISADPNYAGSVTGTLVIDPAPVTINLSNLSQTYDGSTESVTATTTPADVAVAITYSQDGQTVAAPTDAGSYLVSATSVDPNYTGSATGTLVIDPAPVTIDLSNLSQTYNGSAESATATTTPADVAVAVTYSQNGQSVQSPNEAGSYAVSAEVTDPNYSGFASGTLVISPAPVTFIVSDLSQTYDGLPELPTVTTTPAGAAILINYSRNGHKVDSPTDTGDYTVSLTTTDPNYVGSAIDTLVIGPAPATIALSGLSQTYDGSPKVAVVATTPPGVATSINYAQDGHSVVAPTAAGRYAVSATTMDSNYTGSATGTLVIAKANPVLAFTGVAVTYDGDPHAATGSAAGVAAPKPADLNALLHLSYEDVASGLVSASAPTVPGTYAVLASFDGNANYNAVAPFDTGKSVVIDAFSNIHAPPIVTNTPTTKLTGRFNAGRQFRGGNVNIALDGMMHTVKVRRNGKFASVFHTAQLPVGTYSVTYTYLKSPGTKTFTQTGTFTVSYRTAPRFNQAVQHPAGAIIPIALAVSNSAGDVVDSTQVTVSAASLALAKTPHVLIPLPAGNAPGGAFTPDDHNHTFEFNLETAGLAPGRYILYLNLSGDPRLHEVTFILGPSAGSRRQPR